MVGGHDHVVHVGAKRDICGHHRYIIEFSQDVQVQCIPPPRGGASSATCDSVDEVQGREVELCGPVLHTTSCHCLPIGPKMLESVAHLSSEDLRAGSNVTMFLGQVFERLEQAFACSSWVELHCCSARSDGHPVVSHRAGGTGAEQTE
eukprot:4196-Amphidinium_carterae.1